jgi:hypothetical protein
MGPTRRAVLIRLIAAPLTALAGCSEGETVVGPGAGGRKRDVKGREEAEIKERRGRPRRGRATSARGTSDDR